MHATVGGWCEHKGRNPHIGVPGISSTQYPNTWAPCLHWVWQCHRVGGRHVGGGGGEQDCRPLAPGEKETVKNFRGQQPREPGVQAWSCSALGSSPVCWF